MKNTFYTAILFSLFVITTACGYAQNNNSFFGANPSGGSTGGNTGGSSDPGNNQDYTKDMPEDNNPNAVLPGLNDTTPSKPNSTSDFTGDEKRMRQKYRSNIINAQRLILRGSNMMKAAGNNQNNPNYKKGKILKEIGEKSLGDLKAANPFPDQKIK